MRTHILLVVVVCVGLCSAVSGGELAALTPPLGWRSWNSYHKRVTQAVMTKAGAAMAASRVAPGRLSKGGAYSFRALGFVDVGLDDGWQACGAGLAGGFRGADGVPLVNR